MALLIMLVTGLGLNISNIIDLIGSRGFLALFLFVIGSLLIGLLLGGRDPAARMLGKRRQTDTATQAPESVV